MPREPRGDSWGILFFLIVSRLQRMEQVVVKTARAGTLQTGIKLLPGGFLIMDAHPGAQLGGQSIPLTGIPVHRISRVLEKAGAGFVFQMV